MPHILVFAVGAVSLYFAFRWLRRESDRVETSLRRTERRMRRAGKDSAVPLVFDAATGFYEPAE